MKKSIKILALLFLIISLFSCKKDVKKEDTSSAKSVKSVKSDYYFTAIIDNKNMAATGNVLAIKSKVQGVYFYSITAEDKKNEANFMFFYKAKLDLDPTIKSQSFGLSYPDDKGYMAIKDREDFEFKITNETDSYIEGVFSFTAKEISGTTTITVSDGKFKAKKR